MDTTLNNETSKPIEWSQISVRGPQSEMFLQGQISQDLASLDAVGAWSLILRPDGVVITSCWVERLADGFTLTLPRVLGEVTLIRLRRFQLRADCTLALGDVERGPLATTADSVNVGWPGEAEFAAELMPQSFGAAFVRSSISFSKGCFTGQELVGRLDARGSNVPWRLVRTRGPSTPSINAVLLSKGPAGPQGVTTAVTSGTEVVALAWAHRSILDPAVLEGFTDVTIEAIA